MAGTFTKKINLSGTKSTCGGLLRLQTPKLYQDVNNLKIPQKKVIQDQTSPPGNKLQELSRKQDPEVKLGTCSVIL